MILEKDFKQTEVDIIGETSDRIEMGIDTDNIGHLMMILSSNMYQNAIGSIVREYTSNAIDANVEAKCDEPVIVRLKKDTTGTWNFEIQDFGVGLDDEDFKKVVSKYGKSTKAAKADQLGFYGLGTKSAFSYTNTFYYTCRKDGVERKYLMYKSETGFTIDLMFEQPTTERNGVTVTIPLKNKSDYTSFRREIRSQLAYFDNAYFDVDYEYSYTDNIQDLNTDIDIYKEKDFQWSSFGRFTEMHISFGRVNYPIDWKALDINRLSIPIALKFDLDSGLFPVPNRENLIWNDLTKQLVKEKIKLVANWFVNNYNATVEDQETLLKAWDYISVDSHVVGIGDKSFNINELINHSIIPIREVQIKGMKYMSPASYKSRFTALVKDYRLVADTYNGKLRTKGVYDNLGKCIEHPDKSLLLHPDAVIVGNFREYLKSLNYKYFARLRPFMERKHEDLEYYKQQLFLKDKDKSNWRYIIKEFQDIRKQFLSDLFVDGTGLQDSKGFEDYKKVLKAQRVRKGTSNGLNKQQGEVTIGYAKKKQWGGYMFKKETYEICKLQQKRYMTIILEQEHEDDISEYKRIFSKQHVNFARIGVQDLKKITSLKLHNFMTLKEIEKTKLFRRVATGILARRAVENFERITEGKHLIVEACMNKLQKQYEFAKSYVEKNDDTQFKNHSNIALSILLTAKDNDLWDNEVIAEIREFANAVDEFEFITLLEVPKKTDKAEIQEQYQNLISNMMLFKKMKFEEKFPNLVIVVKDNSPVEEDLVSLQLESLTV